MTKPDRPEKPARKGPSDGPANTDGAARAALPALEIVEPMGKRVLIRKDEDRKTTKSGIHLPDKIEIPTITGRIVAISAQVERDIDYPIARYDRVLFNPKNAIPVDLDADNRLYVIPVEDVVAVIRREAVGSTGA